MPATLDLDAVRALSGLIGAAGEALVAAGYSERSVCSWFGTALVSDVRWVGSPKVERSRRGLGAAIALFVAGEIVDRRHLPFLDDRLLGALIDAGLLAAFGGSLRAQVSILPVHRVLVCADRLDDDSPAAVGSPDLSALNMAASLGPFGGGGGDGGAGAASGKTLLDVGTGAGVLALVAARAGARVIGTDIDGRALGFATLSAILNRLSATFLEGDLYAGVEQRFDVVVLNAPLIRAPLVGDAPLYVRSPRGEGLALDFFAGARARTRADGGGEVLCHVQLTPAVAAAARDAGFPRLLALHFADAVDGTPHSLVSLRDGSPGYAATILTPLSSVLPRLGREILDRLHATREHLSAGTLAAAAVRPAPWLALVRTASWEGNGFRPRTLRFGPEALEESDLALLGACAGDPLGTVATSAGAWERAEELASRGLLVV